MRHRFDVSRITSLACGLFLAWGLISSALAATTLVSPIQSYVPVISTLSAWSSGTSLNTTQTIYTGTAPPAVNVQIVTTSTITAGAITFDVTYDGTNWVSLAADQVVDPTSTTLSQIAVPYTLTANASKAFLILPHGAQGLRVRLSTAITGTGTATPGYTLLPLLNFGEMVALSPNASNFNDTATQGTSPWVDNITQFGGSNLSTGTGAGGAGIPRVTVSNDSTVGLNAGSSVVGKVGIDQTTPGTTNAVQAIPGTSGGWTPILENGLSTTVQTIKSSAGKLGAYYCYNPNSSVAYIQIFDTSGTVTLGTTSPKWSIGLPATSGANVEMTMGLNFANAIKVAATTTATGSTAPSTAVDCNFGYN